MVEDEELIRSLAETILQDADYKTLSASNSEEAISLLQPGRKIDVLFTDLALGGGRQGGIYLAVAARNLRPGLSVLYTTGQYVTHSMTALFVEPYGFLEKPYASGQLIMSVGNSLRQSGKLN